MYCYAYYEDALKIDIARSQAGNLIHAGKTPKSTPLSRPGERQYSEAERIGMLEKDLSDALRTEQYEYAVVLQNLLKQLKIKTTGEDSR